MLRRNFFPISRFEHLHSMFAKSAHKTPKFFLQKMKSGYKKNAESDADLKNVGMVYNKILCKIL
jgi:hypothetical protein